MPGQSHAYDLLRRFLQILTTALPTDNKTGSDPSSRFQRPFNRTGPSFSDPIRSIRMDCSPGVVSEKEALWVEDGASFSRGNDRPEEEAFLSALPLFAFPLSDGDSFQGILYLGFSKPRSFLTEEVDLLFSDRKRDRRDPSECGPSSRGRADHLRIDSPPHLGKSHDLHPQVG